MSGGGNDDPREDFEDFFGHSLSGYLIIDRAGKILRANPRFAEWMGRTVDELEGGKFTGLLSIGSRMFFETHLAPLLRMQGYFDEVAVELACKDKRKIRVLINAYERRDENGTPMFIRLSAYRATERLVYEQNLRELKNLAERDLVEERGLSVLREQFIAVLSHDLRNPLGAIVMGASLLKDKPLDENGVALVDVIRESGERMAELIENVMDFARTRMGAGLFIDRRPVEMAPVLKKVIDELRTAHPAAAIESDLMLPGPLDCDPPRISQMLSNLLANAIIYGSANHPVAVRALIQDSAFELSVSNKGRQIAPDVVPILFEPFTRERVSEHKKGLGLGLYIASEIAKAHGGVLSVDSSETTTCFTFRMPVSGK